MTSADAVAFNPGGSALLVMAPGLRVYPVALDEAHPYLLLDLTLRAFPAVPDASLDGKSYPGTAGGLSIGPTVGAGLSFDFGERWSGDLELPWTFVLTPTAAATGGDQMTATPTEPKGVGELLALRLGVGWRI